MLKRKVIISIAIISLIFTCLTPFIFGVYLLEKPVTQSISFGVPFPFISTEVSLPLDAAFPYKAPFQMNGIQNLQFISFLLSYISIFLLVLSIIAILLRFVKKDPRKRAD